jgi:hypothetical protein
MREKLMARMKGIATAFRGNEALGKVQYDFDVSHDGRVTGWIIESALRDLYPRAFRVSPTFLGQEIVEADYIFHLAMGQRSRVAWLTPMGSS